MEQESPRKKRRKELRLLAQDDGEDEPQELKELICAFASDVLGRELRQFQINGAAYLINRRVTNKVMAIIAPPGAGKTLTYIVCGCISQGVTLIIQPTLTLSADQHAKLKQLHERARVTAYNLDDYKSPSARETVEKRIRMATLDTPKQAVPAIFLVVSPQCISDPKKPWCRLMLDLAEAELLRLMVLDELHLAREQGQTLRPEFKKAGTKVIAEVKKISPKTPLVMFTGTAELADLEMVETLCGSKITQISWAPPLAMQKRDVKIAMTCRSAYPTVAKGIMSGVVSDPKKKAISYVDFEADVANTASTLRRIEPKEENCRLDCLEISGTDPPEQKQLNINLFCGNVTDPAEVEAAKLYRALVATSGCACTGVDPPNVQLVTRRGCPPSPSTMFQELGRLLRGEKIPGWEYLYHMTIDTNSYARLVWRTESSPKATREEKDRNLANHLLALKMVVYDDTCIHSALGRMYGRPGASEALPDSCDGMCPVCSGEREAESSPFYVNALQRSLLKVFSESTMVKLAATQNGSHFTAKLKEASLKEGVWADSRGTGAGATRKTIDTHTVDMLVLQMIAAGILECCTSTQKGADGKNTLVVYVRGVMNSDKTGFRFSDKDAYAAVPKARLA